MYPTDLVEEMFQVKVGDTKPAEYHPAQPYEEFFSEGGRYSVRHIGNGSRIKEKINKEERKRQTKLQREAYANNDERYFRPQDRGKVRAFARDFVDSRRMISEFFLIFSVVILGMLLLPIPEVQLVVTYMVWPIMMVTIVLEGIWTSRQVKRRAAELYPEESVRGAGWYAAMRMLQIRRLRLPKPRVKPGAALPEPSRR